MRSPYLLVVIIIFNFSPANAHHSPFKDLQGTDTIALKAKRLEHYYLVATKSSSLKDVYEQKFFDEFPNTFKELNQIYGYDNNTPAPLYSEVIKHIYELFNNLSSINDTLYYKKIISISLGGHWDADAVNAFQEGLRNRVATKPELTIFLLKKMNEKELSGFWYFYFDCPHPKNKTAEALQKIKFLDARIYKIMIEAHEKAMNVKE